MQKLDLSQSVTSQHIQQLQEAGIISCERKAQFRMCKLNKTIQWNLNNRNSYLGICVNKTTIDGLLNERNRGHIQD